MANDGRASHLPPVTLVLGGARSGKSRHAERLIEAVGAGLYLATAEARDDEMSERIRIHRDRRGGLWETVEEPIDIVDVLKERADAGRPILVDCLTLWLSNLLEMEIDPGDDVRKLIDAFPGLAGPVVLVSNEVGLGVIPMGELTRAFVDHAGRMNQAVAAAADRVILVTAGLPMTLKDKSQ